MLPIDRPYHTPKDIRAHFEAHGVPMPLPADAREALARAGIAHPVATQQVLVVMPPAEGSADPTPRCAHCGVVVGEQDHLALHAVTGAEHASGPDGQPLRLLVRHCGRCVQTAYCSPLHTSPDSGHPDGSPAGFCEFLDGRAPYVAPVARPAGALVSGLLLPLPPGLLRWAGRRLLGAVAAAAVVLAAFGAILTSQGQQQSTLKGDTGAIGAQGDSTAGHGYNTGALRVYTGTAPATGNAAETGTKLADVTLPNPCFGAPSAATPSVLTAAAISNSTILATGTAGYARMVAQSDDGLLSTSERRIQMAVSTVGGGGELQFNTLSLVTGGTISITSLTVTHGA